MLNRRSIPLLTAISIAYTALLSAWYIGALHRLSADAYFVFVSVLGPSRPVRLGLLRYAVADHRYVILNTCTPLYMCLAGFALLAAARPTPLRFLLRCTLLFTGAVIAMSLNNAASMWIRPSVGWFWAHQPGLILIYISVYVLCLRTILRAGARTTAPLIRRSHSPLPPRARPAVHSTGRNSQ